LLQASGTDKNEFVLMGIHTQPSNAAAEIDKLDDVIKWTKAKCEF
jgi:hypothetical protein